MLRLPRKAKWDLIDNVAEPEPNSEGAYIEASIDGRSVLRGLASVEPRAGEVSGVSFTRRATTRCARGFVLRKEDPAQSHGLLPFLLADQSAETFIT